MSATAAHLKTLPVCRAGNILLTSDEAAPHGFAAKVADFGLARQLDIRSRVETRTYGTVTHMSHELLCSGIMSKVCAWPVLSKSAAFWVGLSLLVLPRSEQAFIGAS